MTFTNHERKYLAILIAADQLEILRKLRDGGLPEAEQRRQRELLDLSFDAQRKVGHEPEAQ